MRTTLGRLILVIWCAVSTPAVSPQTSHEHSPAGAAPRYWSELTESMNRMHTALVSLETSGNEDEDFVTLMLPHHQAAIDMARTELLHGTDPKVRRLAQEIVADQQSEIELMRLWLKQARRK